jgi:protein ImuB
MSIITPRYICVYLPFLKADLLRRREEKLYGREAVASFTYIITEKSRAKDIVAGCCVRGHRAGVRTGMDLAHARALVSGPVREGVHRARRDEQCLRSLAGWCNRFAPIVGVDGADGLALDIRGMHLLYKHVQTLVYTISKSLRGLGFVCRVGVADTLACAWGVARYAKAAGGETSIVIAPGAQAKAMGPLPVAALRLEPSVIASLREVGLCHVHQVLALPRRTLPIRFGSALVHRLDLATGDSLFAAGAESITPVRPRPPVQAQQSFEGPVQNITSIVQCAGLLLHELCGTLRAKARGMRVLDVICTRTNGAAAVCLHLVLSAPSCNPAHIWSLLQHNIERIDMGEGVESITCIAARTGTITTKQRMIPVTCDGTRNGTHEDSHEGVPAHPGELIDVLGARLGHDRVVCAVPTQSNIPEREFDYVPARECMPRLMGQIQEPARHVLTPRPTQLFERPQELSVIALWPDGPVRRVRWRGEEWEVAVCVGPERIAHEWWREEAWERMYYRVLMAKLQGEDRTPLWAWICKQTPGEQWYAWGVWA